MHYDLMQTLLTSTTGVLDLTVVGMILYSGLLRSWSSLAAFCLSDVLWRSCLYVLSGRYSDFFYTYWCGQAFKDLLLVWVLFDVARSVPGLRHIPGMLASFLASATVTIALGAVWLSSRGHPPVYPLIAEILKFSSSVNTMGFCTALGLLLSVSFLSMGWHRTPSLVTAGLMFRGSIDLTSSHFISWWPSLGQAIDTAASFLQLAPLLFWVFVLLQARDKRESITSPERSILHDSWDYHA